MNFPAVTANGKSIEAKLRASIALLLWVVVTSGVSTTLADDHRVEAANSTKSAAIENFHKDLGDAQARWVERLKLLNDDIRQKGIKHFTGAGKKTYPFQLLTGYAYGEFYDWDLYFENVYLSYYGIHEYCRNNLLVFLDYQLNDGFIPRTLVRPRWRQHFKPFLAQIAVLGSRQSGDFTWLNGQPYARLKKYLDHWFWFQDHDLNGLPVWNSADHSGMDNQMSRAGRVDQSTREGVDLACYLHRELQAMAVIADALGNPTDATAFRKQAVTLAKKINRVFWDEKDGFYYDRDERTGERIRVKSVAGFLPLWAGVATPARARRLVREHLLNTNEFWLAYPVASYARTEPDYSQTVHDWGCNWRGTSWLPASYMIFHGLIRYGYRDAATELARRNFEMTLNRNATTREYYNAETGEGIGQERFWGWSSLGYTMLLENRLGYDPTDLERKLIEPILSRNLGIEFPPASSPTNSPAEKPSTESKP